MSGVNPPIRKTRQSWNESGHAHFLTLSCHQRLPLLSKDRSRRWVIESMRNLRNSHDVSLWAYVILPEHLHSLMLPRRHSYEMRVLLAAIKRPVSTLAKSHLIATRQQARIDRLTVSMPSRTVFRFWQPGGGFDHNVFKERTVREIIDYIHENPVRRGLVNHPCDWKWSSAAFWEGHKNVPLEMDDPYV